MTTRQAVKVLLVDDHPLVRAGLRQLICQEPDLSVCGEAANATEALERFKADTPAVVVLDLSLSNGNGLKLIKRLRTWNPTTRILVVSMHDEQLFAERALQAGANGYVHKRDAAEKVIEAIHQVVKGKVYLSSPVIDQRLLQNMGHPVAFESPSIAALSDRELEVFELIGRGLGTADIARNLNLSIKTVETHRAHIKKKLNLTSSSELVRKAIHWLMDA